MNLDQYNEAAKAIFAQQQSLAQETTQLAFIGRANPTSPEFIQLMTKQWSLIQQMAKLNTDLMMGIIVPRS
jgi:hypothetical protein